ncbi:Protein of unknown function DUF1296 [Macleaya cordata]|uniref:GBF-interacting protein 1 N-terminal domain-containing protein n=1 Tax=Macleaya cordata TaxID=56857 RepID=A0A200QEP8_MACCD|nr:Protein of unknown function DUF1296 [Macleaya cordata]
MVTGSRLDGGTQILSARIQKTIQSIKEIVGNHSDADIYSMLKETNMDPNETAQKLLNQDPFHEVRRKRDKKKENAGYKGAAEPRKQADHTVQGTKSQMILNRNSRRGAYTRNTLPGTSREFRVVKDNRVNQNPIREIKPVSLQCSTSANVQVIPISERSSTGVRADQKAGGIRHIEGLKSSPASNGPSDAGSKHAQDGHSNRTQGKDLFEETRATVLSTGSRVQGSKPYDSRPHSATSATTSSVVGVYSSSSDPVHVPSPDSRSSGTVGAIKREVGVVGVRRQPSANLPKQPSVPSSSFSASLLGKHVSGSSESIESPTTLTKSDQLSQTVPESVMSSVSVSRSFLSSQYSGKAYQQLVGHQKVPQPNMEWKPKLSQKSNLVSPGIIGTTSTSISPPTNNSTDLVKEADHLQEKLSRVNIFENQHVIIPQHLRVPEADRTHLTFGSFGAGFDSSNSFASGFQAIEIAEQPNGEPSAGVSAPSSTSEDVNQVDLLDDPGRNTGSDSPASAETSEHPLPEKNESTSPGNLENYVDIGLVRNNSPSYTPAEPQQQQDPPELSSFPVYDPQTGYDMPFFRPTMDESVQDQGLPSQQEALSSHVANSVPASTVAMMQQQPLAQLYPQVHLSHYPNFMPYRQILSPVYVPPMAVPGYSSNPAYPHPPNGSSYLLMPGSSSHLAAGGLKYGTSQFKPIPAGSPTGFGSFANPAGYPINAQGTVGGASGLEDSTRIKYKDGSLYIPNPQAETSEIWIQTPRELPGMQSAPYFNIPGQAPHGAYLQSHTGHASFNGATAQSAHVQFPGLYHPTPQPTAIGNPHHMVPGMGGNVGVGVAAAAPGAQVGPYQQPQMGHLNWTTNF